MGAGHDHHHHHGRHDYGRAFAIGIALNVGFVAVETVYGFLANSMALLADAGHNLSDVLGLVVAWAGAIMQWPMQFDVSVGVRKDDQQLSKRIDAILAHRSAEIRKLLESYGVPLVAE